MTAPYDPPTPARTLLDYLQDATTRRGDHPAAEEAGGGSVSYAELDYLAERAAAWLQTTGVVPGDRVAIHLAKSIDALAAQLGTMKAAAAYVPVDAEAPTARGAYIMRDCEVRAVITERQLAEPMRQALAELGAAPAFLVLDAADRGNGLAQALDDAGVPATARRHHDRGPAPDDLAYILYTSGSTGRPKGVMLTHRNATAFVDWCSVEFQPRPDDRFSSHAPFHFDLSILDLYLPMKHGATVILIDAARGREPTGLAALIAERRISVWYSTPSILAMLAEYGKLDRHDYRGLRLVLFAGEVFPIKHLRALKACWPHPACVNLFGPTETNVCTWHPIPARIAEERGSPFPIGRVCPHLQGRITDPEGQALPPGQEGELWIAGPNVMSGYWNLPDRTAEAFAVDPDGTRWYRTGDLVVDEGDGVLNFAGRRDRMVKRRGYRIELGEIEAGLYTHPVVGEAAVVARQDGDRGTRITAFLVLRGAVVLSTLQLKSFCVAALPAYMVPDRFELRDALPKTSTDKIDYQALQEYA